MKGEEIVFCIFFSFPTVSFYSIFGVSYFGKITIYVSDGSISEGLQFLEVSVGS